MPIFRFYARSLARFYRWLVYNLSPSFNWSAQGFSGVYRLPSTAPVASLCAVD